MTYKKALLCYSLCWSLLASRFQSYLHPIPALYAKFPAFYVNILPPFSTVMVTYVVGICRLSLFMAIYSVRDARTRGGGGRVVQVAKNCTQACAQNYSGVQFIAPSWGPIPGPSPAPGPVGDWGGYLHGSCRSTNSRRDCNLDVNTYTHVQNELIKFCCHESTQICEYDQVLLSKHTVNRKNKHSF